MDGIDPKSFPTIDPETACIVALIDFRKAEADWKHANEKRTEAHEKMEAAETPFAYAEARMERDDWQARAETFAREKQKAESEYKRMRPYV